MHRQANCHHFLAIAVPVSVPIPVPILVRVRVRSGHLFPPHQPVALSLRTAKQQIGGCESPPSRQMLSNICSSVSAFRTTPPTPPSRHPCQPYRTPFGWTRLAICFMGFTCSGDRQFGIFGKVEIWLALMHSKCDFFIFSSFKTSWFAGRGTLEKSIRVS